MVDGSTDMYVDGLVLAYLAWCWFRVVFVLVDEDDNSVWVVASSSFGRWAAYRWLICAVLRFLYCIKSCHDALHAAEIDLVFAGCSGAGDIR